MRKGESAVELSVQEKYLLLTKENRAVVIARIETLISAQSDGRSPSGSQD